MAGDGAGCWGRPSASIPSPGEAAYYPEAYPGAGRQSEICITLCKGEGVATMRHMVGVGA